VATRKQEYGEYMISRTPIGIDFFDAACGGIYHGRSVLVTGRAGTGKTAAGLAFLSKGLDLHERGLILSARASEDVALQAEILGIPVDLATSSGGLTILEYNEQISGAGADESCLLPPDSFAHLKDILEAEAIQRVVIDTVVPWLALPLADRLQHHVFSFISAFERMNITSMMLLPHPVSTAAVRLRRLIEQHVPVSLTLQRTVPGGLHRLVVNKMVGMDKANQQFDFTIKTGRGFVEHTEDVSASAADAGWAFSSLLDDAATSNRPLVPGNA